MYKLITNPDGKVTVLLRSGKDLVKNNISTIAAQHIIDAGKKVKSDLKGYPICIDGLWYFKGSRIKENE